MQREVAATPILGVCAALVAQAKRLHVDTLEKPYSMVALLEELQRLLPTDDAT